MSGHARGCWMMSLAVFAAACGGDANGPRESEQGTAAGGASAGGSSASSGGSSAGTGGTPSTGGRSVNAGGTSSTGGTSGNAGGTVSTGGTSVDAGGGSATGGASANSGGQSGCDGSVCQVCAPRSSRCVGDAVVTCSSDGTSESAPLSCVNGTCVMSSAQALCEPFVCSPDQTFCDATATHVEKCSADGLSSSMVEDCAANGQACDGAVCLPVVCAAGQLFCGASAVHLCNAVGTASSLINACGSTEHCAGAASPVTCVANVCTPGAATCDGNTATACNSDGSGYESGGTDCTTTARLCSIGTCLDPICTPGDRACDSGAVVQCNDDRLTTSIVTACTASQYCDPATAACRTMTCSPNQPVCAGSTSTVCDALGAGPLSGGTDCAPDYCSSGACTSALFFEDFEDGDYAGWWEPIPSAYTRSIATTGADDTTHSLCMTHVGPNGTSSGVMHTLPSLQPTYISWWARPLTKYSNFIEIYPTNATSGQMIWQIYDSQGNIALVGSASDILVRHALTWYHTELKNLDWQKHTFDYYIDGNLIAAGVALLAPGNQIGLFDYFDYGQGTGGCIDQILMR